MPIYQFERARPVPLAEPQPGKNLVIAQQAQHPRCLSSAQLGQHRRLRVDTDNRGAVRFRGHGKLTGAAAQVDNDIVGSSPICSASAIA